jgi:hypothetical protein
MTKGEPNTAEHHAVRVGAAIVRESRAGINRRST